MLQKRVLGLCSSVYMSVYAVLHSTWDAFPFVESCFHPALKVANPIFSLSLSLSLSHSALCDDRSGALMRDLFLLPATDMDDKNSPGSFESLASLARLGTSESMYGLVENAVYSRFHDMT